ncbi:MAG: hypothetical protein LBK04_07965 [Clostridiales Family XIII bacterium]|nr:hypothetical protein [Clostridiales Family XIII bacterium]
MKKVLAVILLFAMVLAFTACGGSDGGAYKIYEEAANKINGAESVSMDFTLDMKMTREALNDGDMNISMEGPISVVGSGGKIQVHMQAAMDSLGQKNNLTMYYKDGFAYMEMMGSKFKQALSAEQAMSGASAKIESFAKSSVKSSKVEDASGGKKATLVVKGDAFKDQVNKALAQEGESRSPDMNFGDATVVVVVDADGNIQEYSVDMTFDMAIGGTNVKTVMKTKMGNIKIGGITIDFPADLSSYQEMTA